VVGFASDQDLIYLVTDAEELTAFDLTSGRVQVVDTAVAFAVMSPTGVPLVVHRDGAVASVRNRRTVAWKVGVQGAPTAAWGAARNRLLVLVPGDEGGNRNLQLLSDGQTPVFQVIPDGTLSVSPWGDAAAVVANSGVLLVDPVDPGGQRLLRLAATPDLAIFSPSGHRLFVAADTVLHAVDRYTLDVVERLALPGRVTAAVMGTSGHHLLLRPETGDSLWVVDIVSWTLEEPLAGAWSRDFPLVAPDGTVLVRRGDDVVSVIPDSSSPAGQASDPRGDEWMVTAWDPRRPMLETASTAASQAPRAGQTVYVQVSSTSNPEWADHLAGNFRRAGMEARILPPDGPDDPYRVVLGPYASREEAEQTGRRLGLPFWIFVRDTARAVP
jgi:hypothetical protein